MIGSLIVVSCLVLGQADAKDDAKKVDVAAKTRELVLQLNDEKLADRQAAEEALIKLGPPILDHLPRTSVRMPAEVKQRLGRIIKAVESVAAKAATNASRVTLSGKMSMGDVMAALEKQTGNKVVGYEDSNAEIEVDIKDKRYWEALDEILDKAGMTVNQFSVSESTRSLSLVAKQEGLIDRVGNAAYSGLFRFEPVRVQATRNLLNPNIQGMRLAITASWEPRLGPISISQPFDKVTATDENGDELDIEAEGSQDLAVQPGMSSLEMELPFTLPSRDVKRISSLKAEMVAMLPGRVEKFEFKRLTAVNNFDIRRAGVTVTLEQVRKGGELYKFWVRVRFDEAANALESHRGWVFNNPAYIIDQNGDRVENAGMETTRQGENEAGAAYFFALDGGLDGCRFVYETPALIIRMPVTYELKDIELP